MADLLILLVISRLFWDPYWIPSGSMKPTLLVGDYIAVTSIPGGGPRVGDVVVFRHPIHDTDVVFRVVGLSGDKVQMIDGALHLNGTAVQRERVADFEEVFDKQGPMELTPRCTNAPVAFGSLCKKNRWKEKLPNGASYFTLDIGDSPLDDTAVFTVPPGHIFVLGDNRDNALDSRIQHSGMGPGFVPVENVIGRARRIVFSSAGRSLANFMAWRPNRYLKAIE